MVLRLPVRGLDVMDDLHRPPGRGAAVLGHEDADITPNEGSVNPFVVGKPVLTPRRDYRLLVLPRGTDTTTIDESLRDVPASNILSRPTTGDFHILANQVCNAFPGYHQGGAAGPPTPRSPRYGR